jgi:LysR family transcriptional regulator, nitrogen assimilation regulatory protein
LELRRLRYFLRIAAEGSLGKASRALRIAQPALGRQIQLLENELGVRLFQRVAKGMALTDEGEYLKEALEHPLHLVDIALKNVRSYSARVEAALTLGLPPTIAPFLGARLLRRFRRDLPKLKLWIVDADSHRLAGELTRGLIDIALLVDVTPGARAFHSEVVVEQLMLVGPPGALPPLQPPLSFKDLQTLPLVLPGPQSSLRTKLTKAAAGAEISIEVALEIDSLELTKQAVIAGAGFTILPPIAFMREAERGELGGVPIGDPGLVQSVLWAIQPNWRVPRSTYNEVERVVFEEWYGAVASSAWPARWMLDLTRLSLPLRPEPPSTLPAPTVPNGSNEHSTCRPDHKLKRGRARPRGGTTTRSA